MKNFNLNIVETKSLNYKGCFKIVAYAGVPEPGLNRLWEPEV